MCLFIERGAIGDERMDL